MTVDTKQRILDTAERLFAERGYSATSLRTIIHAAGVNLAAVHYHFRSKQELFKTVMARRLKPINEERIAALERAERQAGPAGPTVDRILEAFLLPVFDASRNPERGGRIFLRLFGLLYGESGDEIREFIVEQMKPVVARFFPAFGRALPHLSPIEIYWRAYFSVGVMAHVLRGGEELKALSGGLCDPSRPENVAPRVIEFLTGGMTAPARAAEAGHADLLDRENQRLIE